MRARIQVRLLLLVVLVAVVVCGLPGRAIETQAATGSISGWVRDANNNPLYNASVCTALYDSNGGGSCTNSASDGSYTITGLDAGNYRVRAEADGHIREYYNSVRLWDDANPVALVAGQNKLGINFFLDIGGSISGYVRNAQGAAISGAGVCADPYDFNGEGWCEGTQSDGSYTITGRLATGNYRVEAEAEGHVPEYYNGVPAWDDADPVHVTAGQPTSGINFSLDVGGSISGYVIAAGGNPLSGAWVCANPYDFNGEGGCADAQSDGSYTITGLATGNYRVEAQADGYIHEYYNGTRVWNDATPVPVVEGENTPNINFSLDPQGTISGVVRDANNSLMAGAQVCANPNGGCTNTDADGAYTLTGLATGNYVVDAQAEGYVQEYYNGVRVRDDANPVHVVEGQNTPNINFSLDVEGTISGIVRDLGDHPIVGAWVAASPSVTAGAVYANAGSPPSLPPGSGMAFTDSNGEYTIRGLGTGAYIVSAGGISYLTGYYDGATSEDDATPVSVTQGQNRPNINFSLRLGGSISGVVRDVHSNPISGAQVCVNTYDTNSFVECADTQADGSYSMTGLATGNYRVDAQANGYVHEYFNGPRVWNDATPVPVVVGQNTPNINFSLDVGGSISGVVRDVHSNPISGAQVCVITYDNREWVGCADSQADGSYSMTGLATDDYIVYARANGYLSEYYNGPRVWNNATPVPVVEGQNTPNINFSLDVAGTISGVVRDAGGTPISGAQVCANPNGGCTDTAANGAYTLNSLTTGDYVVDAVAEGYVREYYNGVRVQDDATPVHVVEGQNTPNINFSLDVEGTISGVVRDLGGHPLVGAWVAASPSVTAGAVYANANSPPSLPPGAGMAWTDSNGEYTIRGLGTGAYIVSAGRYDYLVGYYPGATREDDATPVSVTQGQDKPNINFNLALLGDATGNGTLGMLDAMVIAQCVARLIDCGTINQTAADVNCTGTATMLDAMLIAQRVAGLIAEFSCAP